MATKNQELIIADESLRLKVEELARSEARLRYMLSGAPVAIAVFAGRELIIESANDKVLEVWDKDKSIIGMPLHLALPESEGQEYLHILDEVFTSGKPYFGNEVKVIVRQNNKLEEVYFTFICHPLNGLFSETIGIMVLANVVTEQVNARKELEFTLEATELGTWDFNPVSGKFTANNRFRSWFGLPADGDIKMEMAESSIIDHDRERVDSAKRKAIQKGSNGILNITYTIINPINNRKKVIKIQGKALFDSDGNTYRFSGIAQDIKKNIKFSKGRTSF